MKRFLIAITVFLILITAPAVYSQNSPLKSAKTGKTVIIEQDEVINRDYFVTGEQVEIYGTINGDLYAAGGQVFIEGNINGDLLVAGGNVNISGTITQDARVAGGQVSVSANIGKNLTALGGNIDIAESSQIAGSIVGAGGNFKIAAPVNKNLVLGVGNLTLANRVNGDIEAGFGNATLTPDAVVVGDFNYWSEKELSLAKGATVTGKVVKHDVKKAMGRIDDESLSKTGKQLGAVRKSLNSWAVFYGFLSSLIIGLLAIYLAPKYFQEAVKTLKSNFWLSLGVGLLTLILAPVAVVFLLITVLGIPLALILLFAYIAYIYFTKLPIALWLGGVLAKRLSSKMNIYWKFVLGLAVYSLILIIPILNVFIRIFSLLFGLGVLIITCRSTYLSARKKGIY